MKLYENFKNFLKEIDIDFSKFKIQDNLEPNLWKDDKIDYQIKEKLINRRLIHKLVTFFIILAIKN